MPDVPCSAVGCIAPGVRWVHDEIQVARYAFPPGMKAISLDIPRFLCEVHAKELLAKMGGAANPSVHS